jgi:glycosyltransferase involved in cell wall biosynthesis
VSAPDERGEHPHRPLFIYWGRRGALSTFVLELARVAGDKAVFSLSRQNELFERIRSSGTLLVPVDTFDSPAGAILQLPRIFDIRKRLGEAIAHNRVDRVVVLMSHVWTPLLASMVRKLHVRYTVVVHDAVPHGGDYTALVNRWLLQDALRADEIVTLSEHVAAQLRERIPAFRDKVRVLFHPALASDAAVVTPSASSPAGFLFFGRIMAYKGLPLFVEACEILRARGFDFRIGVAGEGSLRGIRSRLDRLGAHVTNRWIDPDEVGPLVKSYDVIVASNVEASQSGVIALGLTYGLPSIATPVGGMVEQIDHEQTGLLADEVSAMALADAMRRIITESGLLARLRRGAQERRQALSMSRFFEAITAQ